MCGSRKGVFNKPADMTEGVLARQQHGSGWPLGGLWDGGRMVCPCDAVMSRWARYDAGCYVVGVMFVESGIQEAACQQHKRSADNLGGRL